MKKGIYLLAVFFLSCVWTGCSKKTKPVDSHIAAIQEQAESQKNLLKSLDKMASDADKALSEGRIAESAHREIMEFVRAERERVNDNLAGLKAAEEEARAHQNGKGKKQAAAHADVVAKADQAVARSKEEVRILERKTEVVIDFLGNVTYSKSEIGALFAPGEYNLIPEQLTEGERLFTPIVEKMFVFAEKYKDSFNRLKGEIIVSGHSDATPINRGSRLYRDLNRRIEAEEGKGAAPDNGKLNLYLSRLRAQAVRDLLQQIVEKQQQARPGLKLPVEISAVGRGEELPVGLPEHVAANDHRRRIVAFYWVVLPGLSEQ